MEKRILIIDDERDEVVHDELKHSLEEALNEDCHSTFTVEIEFINPNVNLDGSGGFDGVMDEIKSIASSKKIDMLLCDFNINQDHKLISFHIIEKFRQENDAATILLYSGNPLRELLRLDYDDLPPAIVKHIQEENTELDEGKLKVVLDKFIRNVTKHEDMFRIVTTANITEFVTRPNRTDRAIYYITRPSIPLFIQDKLSEHGDCTVNIGNKSLDGIPFGTLAQYMRKPSDQTNTLLNEIMDLSIGNFINLNE